MTLAGFRFHHFGLAASQPDRAERLLQGLGYTCGSALHDPLQAVWLRWCSHPTAPAVEIVSPTEEAGPLARVLAGQASSFYHLCWETDLCSEDAVKVLKAGGSRVVTVRAPLPAILFGGRRVSFHSVQGFGLVEILESEVCSSGTSI